MTSLQETAAHTPERLSPKVHPVAQPNQSGERSSVYPPLSNTYSPAGFFLPRSAPSTYTSAPDSTKEHRQYDFARKKIYKSIYSMTLDTDRADTPPKNRQGASATRSRHSSPKRSHVPASQRHSLDKTHPVRSGSFAKSPAATSLSHTPQVDIRPKEEERHKPEMTLLDIDNFKMRTSVAKLMAVAPAISVGDLYHLIVDSKGHMSEAKQRAIRMSEASNIHCQTKRSSRPQQALESDSGDEILVEVDLNDPAFQWDTDEPAPEPVSKTRARPSKPGLKIFAARMRHASKDEKRIKSGSEGVAGCTAKSTKPTFVNPTHARETSSDREFVVDDNGTHYGLNSDDDFDPSGPSTRRSGYGEVKMRDGDDALDLDIDMHPNYAYNTGILRKKWGR
ncbi:hypothetical protein Ptr902_07423 [Pyrenophora tritici-repentis]|nr:hypothetical protein Ptr902_07423 [Pyrenophora tritici-repentis]